jgi:hypothetical protein
LGGAAPSWLRPVALRSFPNLELVAADGERHWAQAAVLAALSPSLRTVLKRAWRDHGQSGENLTLLLDMTGDALGAVLAFLSSGVLLDESVDEEVNEAFNYLGIDLADLDLTRVETPSDLGDPSFWPELERPTPARRAEDTNFDADVEKLNSASSSASTMTRLAPRTYRSSAFKRRRFLHRPTWPTWPRSPAKRPVARTNNGGSTWSEPPPKMSRVREKLKT